MSTGTALVLVLCGLAIGWALRWPSLDRAQRQVDQLRDDLDYLTEKAVAEAMRAHPAGSALHPAQKPLRIVPEQARR